MAITPHKLCRETQKRGFKTEELAREEIKLWVAYFDQDLMGGWHAFVEDIRGRDHRVWIDRDCRHLIPYLMKLFPLILGLGSERDQWEMWKPEFAARFKHRRQHRQPVGVTALWWDRRHSPRLAL